MRRPLNKTHRRQSRGVAMVEFMIVLPVFLFLMFAVTEIGRAVIRYNTLTKSLQDGARHASAYALLGTAGSVSIDPTLDAEIKNLIVHGNMLGTGAPLIEGLTTGQINITVPQPGWIRIDATYPYFPGLGPTIPSFGFGTQNMTFNMEASVTMRAL